METKRPTILALRHWDLAKINNKLANIYWHKKMAAL
jgi:hypothetical protein